LWYDWNDDAEETLDEMQARRKRDCPRLTPSQLESLWQFRKTVWDGYCISKTARDELRDLGLITRCAGWQVITREGLAVLDVYGLLCDDRYGTTYAPDDERPSQMWTRLRVEGWIRG